MKPLFMVPRPLNPNVLCLGIKTPDGTVMAFNENREIKDAPSIPGKRKEDKR